MNYLIDRAKNRRVLYTSGGEKPPATRFGNHSISIFLDWESSCSSIPLHHDPHAFINHFMHGDIWLHELSLLETVSAVFIRLGSICIRSEQFRFFHRHGTALAERSLHCHSCFSFLYSCFAAEYSHCNQNLTFKMPFNGCLVPSQDQISPLCKTFLLLKQMVNLVRPQILFLWMSFVHKMDFPLNCRHETVGDIPELSINPLAGCQQLYQLGNQRG